MIKEMVQMILVLTAICAICGTALSGIRKWTAPYAELQRLNNVQGPKVKTVLDGSDNDLIEERQKLTIDDSQVTVFVGKKSDAPWALAFEGTGAGYGGPITVMVGFDLTDGSLTGIEVISHQETPGVGSKAEEPQFTKKFKGKDLNADFRFKGDGGEIDGISGATYSTRGVCEAVRNCIELYPKVKSEIIKQ